MGKEIVITLQESVQEIKKRVLTSLIEFMPNILGVYLYGSYARNEQTLDSDIDILVITKEKDEKIKNSLKDIDLRVVSIESIKKSLKNYPLLITPIIKESVIFLNPSLLEELRATEIDIKKLKWNFDDIKRIIKIIEKFVEIDDKNIAPSHIYSLIMRIRVCFLIECILSNKSYSNQAVKNLLLRNFNEKEVSKFLSIYREIRDNEETKEKISKEEILNLISFLKKYSKEVENETEKKITKRN